MIFGALAQALERFRLAQGDLADVARQGIGDGCVVSRHAEVFILSRRAGVAGGGYAARCLNVFGKYTPLAYARGSVSLAKSTRPY